MTVRRNDDGTIILDGTCSVEDAEPLLQLLLATPTATVDWIGAERLHTAVVQVILAAHPRIAGPCGDSWVRHWLEAKVP
jgi:hypothetical protein